MQKGPQMGFPDVAFLTSQASLYITLLEHCGRQTSRWSHVLGLVDWVSKGMLYVVGVSKGMLYVVGVSKGIYMYMYIYVVGGKQGYVVFGWG